MPDPQRLLSPIQNDPILNLMASAITDAIAGSARGVADLGALGASGADFLRRPIPFTDPSNLNPLSSFGGRSEQFQQGLENIPVAGPGIQALERLGDRARGRLGVAPAGESLPTDLLLGMVPPFGPGDVRTGAGGVQRFFQRLRNPRTGKVKAREDLTPQEELEFTDRIFVDEAGAEVDPFAGTPAGPIRELSPETVDQAVSSRSAAALEGLREETDEGLQAALAATDREALIQQAASMGTPDLDQILRGVIDRGDEDLAREIISSASTSRLRGVHEGAGSPVNQIQDLIADIQDLHGELTPTESTLNRLIVESNPTRAAARAAAPTPASEVITVAQRRAAIDQFSADVPRASEARQALADVIDARLTSRDMDALVEAEAQAFAALTDDQIEALASMDPQLLGMATGIALQRGTSSAESLRDSIALEGLIRRNQRAIQARTRTLPRGEE